MQPARDRKPEIDYPCRWSYRVVGAPESALRALIAEVCAEADHEIHAVRESREGRYVSVHVSITAQSEDHRTGIHHALAHHESVKIVL